MNFETTSPGGKIAMDNAATSVGTWTARAKRHIDEDFGKGYAAAHPELVAAFIQAASRTYQVDVLSRSVADATQLIADTLLE